MRAYACALALTGLLIAVTLAATTSASRYRVLAPLALENLDFADGLAGWTGNAGEVQRIDGRATLVLDARAADVRYVARSFPLPAGGLEAVRVQVSLRAEAMLAHGEPGAGVMLLSFDRRGRQMWWWPKVVARTHDDAGWHTRTLIVPLSADIRDFWLIAYLGAERGTVWLRDLRIEGVEQHETFDLLLAALVAAWGVLGGWIALSVVRHGWRAPLRMMSLAAALAILGFGLAPQPHARAALVSGFFGAQDLLREQLAIASRLFAPDVVPHPGAEPANAGEPAPRAPDAPGGESLRTPSAPAQAGESDAPGSAARGLAPAPQYWRPDFLRTDKDLHVIGFAVFAFVTVLAWRQHRLWTSGVAVVAVSAALQALQSLTITREADLVDLAHDLAGAGAGVLLAAVSLVAIRAYAQLRA